MIVSGDSVGVWTSERLKTIWCPSISKAIGLEINGRLKAGVICDEFNGTSICMHIAADFLSKRFLQFCFNYAFNQLKVKKVIGTVWEDNLKARILDERLGFILETRIKDSTPNGDLLIYTMTKSQCRWLYGKKDTTAAAA